MSTDFSRTYQPPGTYIDEDDSIVISATGVPPTLVALVGEARGYQVNVEQVPFGDTAIVLSKQGIDVDSVTIEDSSTRLAVDPDTYTLTPTTPAAGADPQDYYVELVGTADNDLDDGTPVFVTYNYTPVDYFAPKRVSSFEDVKDLYGEPLNLATGSASDPAYQQVLSPLSLAAKVAFENGATELVLVATTNPADGTASAMSTARRAALAEGYAKTETDPNINVLVAVATGIITADAIGAFTDLSNHATAAETDGFPRFTLIGFDAGVTTAPDTIIQTSGVKNRHVMEAYTGPGALRLYSGGTNSTFVVSHAYLAAGYAGRMASLPVQQSLTKQVISSFAGLGGTPLSNALKNQYSKAGVAVAEVDRLGRLVVRHGVTTDNTSLRTKEASVVRARDALVTMVANGFADSDLIGKPVDDEMVYVVKSAMSGYLEVAKAEGIIVDYSGLALRQRVGDPSTVEVKFAYKPAYPLNYIAVSFSIDTTTGATADLAEAA